MGVMKFIIGVINGFVVGMGLVIVLFMDIWFVLESVVFMMVFVWCGLIVEYGLSWILFCLVGYLNVFDFLMIVCKVIVKEVEKIGFVSCVIF